MVKRTIMIFPEFENMSIIDDIRDKYDPVAKLVRPHVTLVFPFESELSNGELEAYLSNSIKGMKEFKLELQGFDKEEEEYGNYLFLNVVSGKDEIIKMHDKLYEGELKKFRFPKEYNPHMTVGKLPSVELLHKAFDDVRGINEKFSTIVKKVSVEVIGKHEESIIVIEKEL